MTVDLIQLHQPCIFDEDFTVHANGISYAVDADFPSA